MKRALLALLAVIVIVPLAVFAYQTMQHPDRAYPAQPVADKAAQLQRGAYLARAGDCMACHTARGGEPYAGGRGIATPFGDVVAPNITPDAKTGIGDWSADDFWRALHNGRGRDGRFLYPVFPYTSYTKVSREDSDAMYAWLRTVAPVQQQNREHALRFPYNQRWLLAGWRALYFKPGVYEPVAAKPADWNRGAYLVQGLGHCAACHSSRNALGATSARGDLAGGLIPISNWYAPALTPDAATGLGDWQVADLAALLKTGVSGRSAVYGPMAEVVRQSLQYLHDDDVQAMAVYLKSLPQHAPPPAAEAVTRDTERLLAQGGKLYDKHCVECHGAEGAGKPPAYPRLAGNNGIVASSVNPIRMVLNGGYPPSTAGNPRPYGMPPYGPEMNNDEVAAVVTYIRMSWGNRGAPVGPGEVSRYRTVPLE
ncbi:c-type cytochrome [Noviherbaspirillum suwonense]|uniref:Cytochrome c, mono-and diheme variants n=1 Tax=Noviherbaspirillum suwonense TaxID=1224511 RepID=A0ABY1QHE5_9BURK|nr:cytochrome c [Noviherbaspirillum suwonense]SMP71639.1 Cytochrome c, mono-and diheme variants [Noviherbaspirillum suwonense]